ncbi:MAG TPA: orotidine 5'-phosphate decarboxylase / HUMPS family protein [Negativicutes bacterium]|nr:orotidine 5'-phosphate decarboxylase / HUMPS family protein [Negativicutes bacterium]
MKLQLALDLLDEHQALEVTRKAGRYFDIIEVGTSLLKLSGVGIVQKIRAICPDRQVFVDIKIIDGPEREATLMRSCRADYYSMLACATDTAVAKVLAIAALTQAQVVFDLQSVADPIKRCKQLQELGAKYVCVHKNAACGENLLEGLQEYTPIHTQTNLASFVAGGISLDGIAKVRDLLQPEGVIIGSAILDAVDMVEAARNFRLAADA